MYIERKRTEKLAHLAFENWCKDNNIEWADYGYETLRQSENFEDRIVNFNKSDTDRFRYMPDKICIGKKLFFVEIKTGKNIERDAYFTYLEIDQMGPSVYIFHYDDQLSICHIRSLKFKRIDNYYNMPIEDDKWICPSNLSDEEFHQFRNKTGGSGTAYGIINFQASAFKNIQDGEKKKDFIDE